jgi:hypothetical protein
MDDYDYLDEVYQGAGGFDVPAGIPIDLPNIDVRDLGLGSIDFGSFFDPTDLGDYLSSFNTADLTDIFDPTDISLLIDFSDYEFGYGEDITDRFIPETTYTQEQTFFRPGDTPQFDFGYGEDITDRFIHETTYTQ